MPISKYALFRMGSEFSYLGFNGQVKGVSFFFGKTSYVHDIETLETIASQKIQKPFMKELDAVEFLA
jgi:hypothetical protein